MSERCQTVCKKLQNWNRLSSLLLRAGHAHTKQPQKLARDFQTTVIPISSSIGYAHGVSICPGARLPSKRTSWFSANLTNLCDRCARAPTRAFGARLASLSCAFSQATYMGTLAFSNSKGHICLRRV